MPTRHMKWRASPSRHQRSATPADCKLIRSLPSRSHCHAYSRVELRRDRPAIPTTSRLSMPAGRELPVRRCRRTRGSARVSRAGLGPTKTSFLRSIEQIRTVNTSQHARRVRYPGFVTRRWQRRSLIAHSAAIRQIPRVTPSPFYTPLIAYASLVQTRAAGRRAERSFTYRTWILCRWRYCCDRRLI